MKEELLALGLTQGEIAVYLALLKLGPSTNTPITKHTQLQSSSVYYCLNSLIEKGFVSYVIRNNRKHFIAVDPESIPTLIDEKVYKLREQKIRIEKTTVEVYEGFGGLKTIFREVLNELKKGDHYQAFVIEQAIGESEETRLLFTQHNKKLKAKGVTLRLLAPHTMKKVFEHIYGKKFLKTYQKMKYTRETVPVGITIYKDTVITHISEEGRPMSFKIKNKKLADMYISYFNEVWNRVKP